MADNPRKGIFAECIIAFVPSSSLVPKSAAEYARIVEKHGATVLEPRRDGSLRIADVTHIVSNTIDFPQYTDSQAYMIPVITIDWIASSVRRGKLAQVRPFSPDPRMIFSQVTVTCADLPVIDKETIIGATLALGGMESVDLSRQTTHICALSVQHDKCVSALERNLSVKIVLPHWFEDCFKLGKRIDEGPYLLPKAEILNKDPYDIIDIPENNNLQGATDANPNGLSEEPAQSSTIFRGKSVMVSTDLNISQKAIKIMESRIINGGGGVVSEVDDCDMFICQYREGPQYVRAAQLGKDVGNLAWLLHLISHNEWTSPLRRLLHYPVPKEGIPGFKDLRISISNYSGDARIYLENLIKACGATYTKTMKSDNTHLITARSSSEKYEAAKDWGVETANHLWIEESYAKCEKQPITIGKYTHFPPRTNLGEIIGQTFFDEPKLRARYYPGPVASPPDAKRKRKVLERAHENSYLTGPAEGLVVGRQKPETSEDAAEDEVKTPARARRSRSDMISNTPSILSTGSRSAKSKALDNLHAIATDIALYEKEKKRGGKDNNGLWGGKRAADEIDKTRGKRMPDAAALELEEEEDAAERRASKRRRSSPSDNTIKIMVTGFHRWVDGKHKEDVERRKLREMGIKMVTEVGATCDYLCAPFAVRTVKFLCTLAKGVTILSTDYIEDLLKKGKMIDPEDYLLNDKENEEKIGVSVETVVSRARANNGKLLAGIPIYCTANVRNGPDSYRPIAQANGGQFMQYTARSGVTIRPTTAEEDGGAPPDPVYLLSSGSTEERKLWPKFVDMAEKGHMEPRIVAPDWLLDVAMKQQVSFEEKYLADVFFSGTDF